MTPAKEVVRATLPIYKNLPWALRMYYRTASGLPIDMTGWEGKLILRASLSITDPILHQFSTFAGTIVLGNGVIDLSIPDAATINAFTWTQAVGHLVLKEPLSVAKVLTLLGFVIRPSTTDEP